jgi:hypothetical protein
METEPSIQKYGQRRLRLGRVAGGALIPSGLFLDGRSRGEDTTVALHIGVIKRLYSGWPTLSGLVYERVGSGLVY